jgi:GNAT superfamily N-acetyltransferase
LPERQLPRDVVVRDDGVVLRLVAADDPVMSVVADLCYETLHRPFGVTRCDAWNETDPGSTHLVALDGGRLAGYARLIREGRVVHIRQVGVARGYRRRGIAAQLVGTLVGIARDEGFPVVYLNARLPALPLYHGLGFRVAGPVFRMGRTWLPHVRMEQRLR